MFIKEVTLHNFKSIKDLKLQIDGLYNKISGENTTGKTTFLQALSLLSNNSCFQRSKNKDFLSGSEDSADISILYYNHDDKIEHRLSCNIDVKRKKYNLDGKNVQSLQSISDLIPSTLYFDPEDVFFFKDNPYPRRKILNDILSFVDDEYRYSLNMYQSYMENRNASIMRNDDKDIIRLYRNMLIRHSYVIIGKRKKFISKLSPLVNEIYQKIFHLEDKQIELRYKTNCSLNDNKEQFQNEMLSLFQKKYEDEMAIRRTLVGPHTDDFCCFINKIDISDYGSQSENRIASLSLKIAILEMLEDYYKEKPILLLDDLCSDLDDERKLYLTNYLSSLNQQIFITTTDDDIKDNYKIYATKQWRK